MTTISPPSWLIGSPTYFPLSEHVARVGLASASDFEVWDYAKENSLTIVSKDSDLSEIGMVRGFPPRIVWIRKGNCSTSDIESLLRDSVDAIFRLGSSAPFGILRTRTATCYFGTGRDVDPKKVNLH